jgi:hypothetical protein
MANTFDTVTNHTGSVSIQRVLLEIRGVVSVHRSRIRGINVYFVTVEKLSSEIESAVRHVVPHDNIKFSIIAVSTHIKSFAPKNQTNASTRSHSNMSHTRPYINKHNAHKGTFGIFLFFILPGIALLVWSLLSASTLITHALCYSETSGIVIKADKPHLSGSTSDPGSQTLEITFKANGREYDISTSASIFDSSVFSVNGYSAPYHEGQSVVIIYDNGNVPATAFICSPEKLIGSAVIYIMILTVLIIVSGYIFTFFAQPHIATNI